MNEQHEHERFHYQLQFAVEGRIRFLSHLETVDTLLSSLRRAGITLALSQGMKPKPLIKVAMPRPVGVEAWGDIVEIELPAYRDPDELAFSLSTSLPRGILLQSVRRLDGRYASAASRVAGATFRVVFGNSSPELIGQAVDDFLSTTSFEVERRSPRKTRTVDVRAVIGDMSVIDPATGSNGTDGGDDVAVRFYTRLTAEGSARPQEVVRALEQLAGRELTVRRIIREAITLSDSTAAQVAEPALVGADVPDGPDKPWGAC